MERMSQQTTRGFCQILLMRRTLVVFALLLTTAPWVQADLPLFGLRFLSPIGKMDTRMVPESSGLVQSLRYSGLFWALSDSGNDPEIIPITADGQLAPGWSGPVTIEGVRNRDWEDLALDGKGNLIIADTGNNRGQRKDLKIHFVNEPKPGITSVRPTRTLSVYFEDQKEATPNYDCEAVFEVDGKIFFLTKHHTNQQTRLYRLEGNSTKRANPLRYVDTFDIGGMVTSADTSPNGKFVAVLTYTMLWVFEYNSKTATIFDRSIRKLPIFAWQAEAVAFDGNDAVVISNEGGQLYRVPLANMKIVRSENEITNPSQGR